MAKGVALPTQIVRVTQATSVLSSVFARQVWGDPSGT